MRAPGRRWWLVASASAAAIGTAGAFLTLPQADTTWLLYVTERMLDGARLGVDIVENSPPVILWIKAPAVLLAGAGGWDPWLVWVAGVSVLGSACLLISLMILRRVPSLANFAELLAAVLAVGFFLLPLYDFGQREHLAVCLVVPWLIAAAARAEGTPLRSGWASILAVGGGLGLSIKPHFALVWLAVTGVLVLQQRDWRLWRVPEVVGAALVPALAALTALLLHPDWLGYARLYGPLYQQFGHENPLWVGLVGEGVAWFWLGILALLAFSPLLRPWPQGLAVLVSALVAFYLAAVVQMKGWGYHFLPAGILGLLVAVAAGARSRWSGERLVRRVYRVAIPLGALTVAWIGVQRTGRLLLIPAFKWAEPEVDPNVRSLLAEVGRSGHRETLLMLSTNIGAGFPLAHLARADWTMRHPSLWALGAIYSQELHSPGLVKMRAPADQGEEERRLIAELERDVAMRPPTIVIAPGPALDVPLRATSQRFDYFDGIVARVESLRARCLAAVPVTVGAYFVARCGRPGEARPARDSRERMGSQRAGAND